jgi:aspartyl protease/PDZ domain-containing protein
LIVYFVIHNSGKMTAAYPFFLPALVIGLEILKRSLSTFGKINLRRSYTTITAAFGYREFLNSVLQSTLSFCLIILSLFINPKANAQARVSAPNAKMISRFSFKQLYGGAIMIMGKLGNYPDSMSFILDTGCSGISLDSATAADLQIPVTKSNITVNGIGGHSKAGFIYAQALKLPGLEIDSLDFHVTDYAILTSFYGEKINGIIGYSVLKNYAVELDYDRSLITFYSKGVLKYPKGGYLLKPYINFQVFQDAFLLDSRKIQSNFIFDIGADLCLMLSSDFDNDSTPLKRNRKRFIKQAEGVGGKIVMQTTVMREFKLGPYKFKNVPVCVFDDACNVTSYPYGAGIIGNELLRRFNITLNYGNKEIFLKPNSHFRDLFDYSYTGIELCFIQGVIIISDITAGSPGEKAGLKTGDIVMAINNTVSQSLSVMKEALLKATDDVKVIIVRTGTTMEFQVKIKSIL